MIDRKNKTHPCDEDISFVEVFAEKIRQFLEIIFSFLRPSCTFEEFLKELGEYFDKCIIQAEEQKSLRYVNGRITFELFEGKVEMCSKLYFMDESGNILLHDSSDSIMKTRFNDWDTDKDLIGLSEGETIEFDINPPE